MHFINKDPIADAYEFYSCDLSKEYVEINLITEHEILPFKITFNQEDIFEDYFAFKVNKDIKNFFLPLEKNNKNELFLYGLQDYEKQINDNVQQFVSGYTFNNLLITGAIGCGKTSLIKKLQRNIKIIILN